jgi:hypothetical protein
LTLKQIGKINKVLKTDSIVGNIELKGVVQEDLNLEIPQVDYQANDK